MGQILQADKIGLLSHSAGSITLTASVLTVGGQQYVTSSLSRTIATDITMVANTRYQIYAIQSGGAVSLKISANENSVGPSGSTSWKLVGSFYSNKAASFGTFVTIEGVPTTSTYSVGTITVTATGSNPTKGSTIVDVLYAKRIGDKFFGQYKYRQVSPGSTGSGTYKIGTEFEIDLNKLQSGNVGGAEATIGSCSFTGGGAAAVYSGNTSVLAGSPPAIIMSGLQNGDVANAYDDFGSTSGAALFASNDMEFSGNFQVPIVGWSETPIKDL